jgi:hypothetical protein
MVTVGFSETVGEGYGDKVGEACGDIVADGRGNAVGQFSVWKWTRVCETVVIPA